jgi:hypothetical protein
MFLQHQSPYLKQHLFTVQSLMLNSHVKLTEPFEYDFLQFTSGSEPEAIETDVVIVGSGCGGAVCAKNIAEAGHRVVVVEKAYHIPASQLPLAEATGLQKLFEAGALLSSDNGSISVAAGSAWGGGGTVNVSNPKLDTIRF